MPRCLTGTDRILVSSFRPVASSNPGYQLMIREQTEDVCLDLPLPEIWDRTVTLLASSMSTPSMESFVKPAQLVAVESSSVTLAVANDFTRGMLMNSHRAALESALATVLGRKITLKVIVDQSVKSAEYSPTIASIIPSPVRGQRPNRPANSALPEPGYGASKANLNQKHSFESFIVGSSNRFCHSAAMAVSEKPGQAYNPLFIYGGVGLGKTHLLHAVGNAILQHAPNTVVRYMSCEKFTNELINSLRDGSMQDFRRRYRQIDVLLMDDVQFIEKKEATQEEFFHTFNALRESGKQIVLSSDRPPQALSHLTERLRSRFEWGLIADVQAPDYEMRLAILQRKAEVERMVVSEEILPFIAENFSGSIRELEGALLRAHAYTNLTGSTPHASTLRDILLPGSHRKERRIITVEHVINAVASYFRIEPADIKSSKRSQDLTAPRHIAMYLAHEMLSLSFPRIGAAFGNRKHTSVIYAYDKIKTALPLDAEIASVVKRISQELEA